MKAILRILVCALAIFWIGKTEIFASHAMGADLTYTCLGGNQYTFTLSFYRDCSGITPSISQFISATSASCGQTTSFTLNQLSGYPIEVSPLCAAQLPSSTCSGGTLPGVQQYVYEGTFTLPANCNDWIFSYSECCRNSTITTLSNPGSENLYVQSTLDNLNAPCNSSPSFTSLPVPYICAGQSYIYNHGAIDVDGDSLVYSLIDAQTSSGVSVGYNVGFNGLTPLTSSPAVTIDPANGNVTLNPTTPQVGVIAVLVEEYRNGVLVGSSIRDIQVTVLNCSNNSPTINSVTGLSGGTQVGPFSIEICPGQNLNFTIPGSDIDVGQTISWNWNNGIPGGVFTGPTGSSPQSATFSWTPTVADVGLHSLTVSLTDDGCPVVGSQIRAIDILVLEGTSAGPDQVYCTGGGPVILNAVGGTAFTWNILSGSPGSLSCTNCQTTNATPTIPTVYEVVSNLPGACKTRDTVLVTPAPSFALSMNPNDTLCIGSSTNLGANPSPAGAYTYLWSPSISLSANNVQNPTATPTATTNYAVTVTSAAGCRITGNQTITIDNTILTVSPTASPVQSCQGTPVSLRSNVSTGDCDQYTGAPIPFAPVAVGGTNLFLGDDELSTAIPMGFSFDFFCNTYTEIYIASNGILTFDPLAGSGCCSGQLIPDVFDANDVIALCWDDLYPLGAGTITYQTLGVAPNRRFVVSYTGIPFCCGTTGDVTTQAILYETTNVIEFHNTQINPTSVATQGIENSTGTSGFAVPGRNSSAWSATNDAYRFSPVPPAAYTVSWQAPLGTVVGTGDSIVTAPPATTTFFAVATNGVCDATAPVTVEVANANAGPDQFVCPVGSGTSLSGSYNGPPAPSNCNSYTVASIPYAPFVMSGTSVTLNDDDITPAIPIGFNFDFFCQTKTNFFIAANGFVTFNPSSGSGCCSGEVLPSTTLSDFIAGTWNDLYPLGGGTVSHQIFGTAPNRILVVEFNGINHCCSAGPVNTFQIMMYETSNIIEIHSTEITDDGSVHTQGIQGTTGIGFAVPGRDGSNFTTNNTAFRFSPLNTTVTYSWAPATNLSATNIPNPTVSTVTGPINYILTVDNGVCIMTDTIFVDVCLPVDQLNLRAEKDGNAVRLNWESLNEMNLDRYVIERSENAQNWSDIGAKDAIGLPNMPQNYGSYDRHPLVGRNYYRLRVIGDDGSTSHSNMVEVYFAGNEWVQVVPNPSKGLFNFEIATLSDGGLQIEVFNTNGQLIDKIEKSDVEAGLHNLRVDLSKLASGVYVYRVKTPIQTLHGRLVKMD